MTKAPTALESFLSVVIDVTLLMYWARITEASYAYLCDECGESQDFSSALSERLASFNHYVTTGHDVVSFQSGV